MLLLLFFFLMIRRPPRSTQSRSSAASDVYKRQLNKEAINLAGYHYTGHTEIYADFTNTKNYSMMLAEGKLRVVHVSTHVSLRQACDNVKKERVYDVIKLAYDTMRDFGICLLYTSPSPRDRTRSRMPSSA